MVQVRIAKQSMNNESKLCKHVGQIASCTNREVYEWWGSTVFQTVMFLKQI